MHGNAEPRARLREVLHLDVGDESSKDRVKCARRTVQLRRREQKMGGSDLEPMILHVG